MKWNNKLYWKSTYYDTLQGKYIRILYIHPILAIFGIAVVVLFELWLLKLI